MYVTLLKILTKSNIKPVKNNFRTFTSLLPLLFIIPGKFQSLVEKIKIGGEDWLGLGNTGECFHLHRSLEGFCFLHLTEGPTRDS